MPPQLVALLQSARGLLPEQRVGLVARNTPLMTATPPTEGRAASINYPKCSISSSVRTRTFRVGY
jgi:hypothetical protein